MKQKRIIKCVFILLTLCTLLFSLVITAQAIPVSQAGNLPSTKETGYITVRNAAGSGNTIEFKGKLVGDYRLNGNTALCNYSAGDGVSGFSGNTTKYILGNDTIRAKIMYYLTPQRGSSETPSGRNDRLPSAIYGKSFLWLYQQLSNVADLSGNTKQYYDWLYSYYNQTWFQTSKLYTYSDVVQAALYYQMGVSGDAAAESSNQYVVIHSLMDYVQHGRFTAPSSNYVAEEAAILLFKFMDKFEGNIPALPNSVRAFIVNPEPNNNTQTLISIEYYRGYFKIKKSSSNSSVTTGNTNYSLSGAEYSWYKTRSAAVAAANAVAKQNAVPKGTDYVGYSRLNSNGEATTMYPKGSTSAVSLYSIGTYYLVETKAPAGYALNSEVRTLNITSSNRSSEASATVSFADPPLLGSLSISKSGSNSSVTTGNDLYSLTGAEYTVYKDSTLNNVYAIITTRDGSASLNSIPFGTYFVKETKAPKGYKLDESVHQVLIDSSHASVSITSIEPVNYVSHPTLIRKQDSRTSKALEGAKFTVEYYDKEFDSHSYDPKFVPKKKWLFKTDSDGYIKLDTAHLATSYTDSKGKVINFTNDTFYLSESDNSTAILPQGTIIITEVEAPIGYDSEGNRYKYKLDPTPTIRQVIINSDNTAEYKTVNLHNEMEGALSTSIHGEKTWIDSNNANGNRPAQIIVKLIKNVNGVESVAATTTTNATNNWKYIFTDQPLTETVNGKSYNIVYRIEEEPVAGYSTSYSGFNTINTEDLTSVTVKKVWNDYHNQDNLRPNSIIVRLYANSVYTGQYASLSEDNNWSYTFKDLPIEKNKTRIVYTIKEDSIDKYTSFSSAISGDAKSGFKYTLINTHEPEKTSVVVKKKWNDTNDLDKIRPRSIQVNLKGYVNDTLIYQTDTVTMSEANNATEDFNVWSYTFENLDKYYEGHEIDYVATELTLINEYNLDENGEPQTITAPLTVQEDGTFACVLENTHILKKINIDVLKVWDDDDNRDGLRPKSTLVYLMTVDANGIKTRYEDESGNEVSGVLSEANEWTWQFKDLPIFDNNNHVIKYSVEELVPAGYTVSYTGDAGNGITVTNTHHEETSLTVTKKWEDNNNQDGIRPSSIIINLLANGTKINEIELNGNNNWKHVFTNLPVNQDGKPIKYSVTEEIIPIPESFNGSGYSTNYSRISGSAETGFYVTVTNIHDPETRDISVIKSWKDGNNADGIRPKQVEVKLSAVSPSDTGIGIKYGYLSAENRWTYIFKDLPKYFNGDLIQYEVDETDIDIEVSANGYKKLISGTMDNGFVIRNTHQREKIKVILRKVWDDNNNSELTRPDNAEFEITGYNGQVTNVTLNEANNWYYECEYNKYYQGKVQTPSIKEIHLPKGYVAHETQEKSDNVNITTYEFTFRNSYEPEPSRIPVIKIWDDFNDIDYIREQGLEDIVVNLYRRQVGVSNSRIPLGHITLDESTDWQGYFEGHFPRYINDVEYEYFVEEYARWKPGFSGYNDKYEAPIIEGDIVKGFTITNVYHLHRYVDLPFLKVWDDENNRDGLRPESIDIVLTGYVGGNAADGDFDNSIEISKQYATVKASDDWKYTFYNLPATFNKWEEYNLDEPWIYYYVEEVNIPKGYSQTLNHQHYEVVREDNEKPIHLYTYLSTNEYEESLDQSYSQEYWLGQVNVHSSEKTKVTVNKVWDDNNNKDKVRPDNLTVNLLANGDKIDEAVLSEENNWSYTFTNLNIYANGSQISYTVTENPIARVAGHNEYVLTQTDIEGNVIDGWVYTLTNHYDPVITKVSVVKRWRDGNNMLGNRPDNLLLILKADGIAIQTYTMTTSDAEANSGNNWVYTFTDLPKYNNGIEIQYTVEEQLSSHDLLLYKNTNTKVTTSTDGYKTFTFTNSYKTVNLTMQKRNERGSIIDGAVFELYFIDGTPVILTEITQGKYSYNPTSSTGTNRITFVGGVANITTLPPDAIIIAKEVTAPNEYSTYPNDIIIDVQKIIKDNNLVDNKQVYTLPRIRVNNYKTIMPATGGVGDFVYYIISGIILIGAIMILRKKRKDVEL